MSSYHTYIFYKPFNCLSQFTREHPNHVTLADYLDVPSDCYPIGRLDKDSEGLLLLSNDKSLVHKILDPDRKKYKTYIVQLEGAITDEAISLLSEGVDITIKSKSYHTLPAKVRRLESIPEFPPRVPPVRFRLTVPTSWIEISIREGKNRQVRRMCAAVGFPVLRLIRIAIGSYKLDDLQIGEYKRVNN